MPERKPNRLAKFDYNSTGAYFLTICTNNRCQILSRIVGGDVIDAPKNIELLPFGKIADIYINQLNDFYDHITVDSYVIMPNHIHIMLLVSRGGASRTSPPTSEIENDESRTPLNTNQHSCVSQFVSTFKRFCNKEYGKNIWQRYFHDHIIRNREDYEEHLKYIYENPTRWFYDDLYIEI